MSPTRNKKKDPQKNKIKNITLAAALLVVAAVVVVVVVTVGGGAIATFHTLPRGSRRRGAALDPTGGRGRCRPARKGALAAAAPPAPLASRHALPACGERDERER